MKLALRNHGSRGQEKGMGEDLTVVVPHYQESQTLGLVAMRVLHALPKLRRLIVVDDGSAMQATGLLPSDPRILQLRHASNRGKGAALKTALAAVDTKYVALHDADLEYDPADIARLLRVLRLTNGVAAVGTRRHAAGWSRARFSHRCGNRVFSWLFNVVHGSAFTDVTAGTKVFERAALDRFQLREERWGTDVEILARLAQTGFTLEVPISYEPRSWQEGKKIRPWHALQILRSMWSTAPTATVPFAIGGSAIHEGLVPPFANELGATESGGELA